MKRSFQKILKVLGIIFLCLILLGIIAASVGYYYLNNQNKLGTSNILKIHLPTSLSEKSTKLSFLEEQVLGKTAPISFHDCLHLIAKASTDNRIQALLIDGRSKLSMSQTIELGEAIQAFKQTSDKKVYAYADFYTQAGYLLSTYSDSLFISPMGNINLVGFGMVRNYMQDFLQRYDIDVQVVKEGKYKSYPEQFTRNDMSDYNREQSKTIIEFYHQKLKNTIAENRQLPQVLVDSLIQQFTARDSKGCIQNKLVDQDIYHTDFKEKLKSQYGKEETKFINLKRYKSSLSNSNKAKAAQVAFVVIEGAIGDEDSETSSSSMQQSFQAILENDDIQHILVRVNSGGGGAFESDEIMHEINRCKAVGKQVIASVSNVAASGAYYAILPADKIFADQTSIIGSIGVFSIIPNFKKALSKHLGVHSDHLKSSPYALFLNPMNSTSDQDLAVLKENSQAIYKQFKSHVSTARNLSMEQVEQVAQGRIYTGQDALKHGLIDSTINLSQSIEYLKASNELDQIEWIRYPQEKKNPFKLKLTAIIKGQIDASMDNLLGQNTAMRHRFFPSISKMDIGRSYMLLDDFLIE